MTIEWRAQRVRALRAHGRPSRATREPAVEIDSSGTRHQGRLTTSSLVIGHGGLLVHLKQHLKSYVALAGVTICIVMASWIGLVIWGRLAGPTVDETGIVTVVAYVDGNVGRHGRRFRHLVRTTSGAEYRMTFGELYPVGARLSVNYRRFARGDTIKVMFYSRVPE